MYSMEVSMSNPPSSNYIKVKSRRALRRENEASLQRIYKAGTNDIDNQPGATGINTPISSITGVPQPDTVTSDVQFGEALTTYSGDMGKGSVGMPPEKPRPILTSNELHYPYSYTQRQRQLNRDQDYPADNIQQSGMSAGANISQPEATTKSGTVAKYTDRTTGPDPQRLSRERLRRKKGFTDNAE